MSRRGKRSRRQSFRTKVTRVVRRNLETKYTDNGEENLQLYHDVGRPCSSQCFGACIGDLWSNIPIGTQFNGRIGDQITPIGAKYRLWISNKATRPNVMYRILICSLKRTLNNVITTTTNVNPLYPASNNGMICPVNMEKVTKVFYDRIFKINNGWGALTGNQFECSKCISIWLRPKRARIMRFDSFNQIMNNPVYVYVIPYDAYGTLTTDNIASVSYTARLYYKDG